MSRIPPKNRLFRQHRRSSNESQLDRDDTLAIFSILQTAMIAMYLNPLPNELVVRSAIKCSMGATLTPRARYFITRTILGDRSATSAAVSFFNTVLKNLDRPLIKIPTKAK